MGGVEDTIGLLGDLVFGTNTKTSSSSKSSSKGSDKGKTDDDDSGYDYRDAHGVDPPEEDD